MAANQAPNTTCFCRLTAVCSRACSAGASSAAASSTAGSTRARSRLRAQSHTPSTASTRIRLVHTYPSLSTVVTGVAAGAAATGRVSVVVVRPRQ